MKKVYFEPDFWDWQILFESSSLYYTKINWKTKIKSTEILQIFSYYVSFVQTQKIQAKKIEDQNDSLRLPFHHRHPSNVNQIIFLRRCNKIRQFLSITSVLQYQTVYPQQFFDMPVVCGQCIVVETRGRVGYFPAAAAHHHHTASITGCCCRRHHRRNPRRKPRHGLCIQTVPTVRREQGWAGVRMRATRTSGKYLRSWGWLQPLFVLV